MPISIYFFCAAASSMSLDGLPSTVLLQVAYGSSRLVPDVPESGMQNEKNVKLDFESR